MAFAFFRVTPRPVTTFCSKEVRSPKLWQLNRRAHVPVPRSLEALVLLPSTEHRNCVWHSWNEENIPVKNMCKTTCFFFAWKTLQKKDMCQVGGRRPVYIVYILFTHADMHEHILCHLYNYLTYLLFLWTLTIKWSSETWIQRRPPLEMTRLANLFWTIQSSCLHAHAPNQLR